MKQEATTTDALIDAMERQAESERQRIVAEARARAAEVLAAADRECERLTAEALRALEKELAVERQRIVGEAVMKARIERLHMKRRLLAEVFRLSAEEVTRRAASPTALRTALDALAAEARAAMAEPCDVTVKPEDGTVVAVSADGRRRVDNGLTARLRRAESSAEREAARLLFGGGRS